MEKEIISIRKKIDQLDEQLVRLLNERARWALKIGQLKKRSHLAVKDPQREREIFSHVQAVNNGPLSQDAITRIFQLIIKLNRELEEKNTHHD